MSKAHNHERNIRMSQTGFKDTEGKYWVLDNAAIIMPAVSNSKNTFTFRISASLDHPVVYDALAKALEKLAIRFPYFIVYLKRGFFWYYLQSVSTMPKPELDDGSPNMGMDLRQRKSFLFRVRVYGSRIACEFTHILSDGNGCLVFLRVLLQEYFRQLGIESTAVPGDPQIDKAAEPEEYEDAYQRYYKSGVPGPMPRTQAFHIKSSLLEKGQYRVICGEVPVSALSSSAKARGVSINDFLVACYMDALIQIRNDRQKSGRRPKPMVTLEVPVNMRKFYPSRTLRNFTLFALPWVDLRHGTPDFEELVRMVHYLMRLEGTERMLASHISRNAGGGRSIFVRLVPLWIKDAFARLLFKRLGEGTMSGLMSNLGKVQMPAELEKHIKRMDFIGAPSTIIKTGASLLSWNGITYINFHSLAENRDVERLFFQRLASLGIPVTIESY